jgi:hypothetical protein
MRSKEHAPRTTTLSKSEMLARFPVISKNEIRGEIIGDFLATSGLSADEFRSKFSLPIPKPKPERETWVGNSFDSAFPTPPEQFLYSVVTTIVQHIIDIIGKKLTQRADEKPPRLTEAEIAEIRQLVINFERKVGQSRRKISPEVATKMADSVERVIRRNPRVLMREYKK